MKAKSENLIAELTEAQSAESSASHRVEQMTIALHMSQRPGPEAHERNAERQEQLMEEKQRRIQSATDALKKGEEELAKCRSRAESINDKMKKEHSDIFTSTEALMERRGKLESKIARVEKMIPEVLESLRRAETEWHPESSNEDALGRIGRLQVMHKLLPGCHEGAISELAAVDDEIKVVCDLHVLGTISDLAHKLEVSLLSKLRKDLQPHFDSGQLEQAVQSAAPLQALRRIAIEAKTCPYDSAPSIHAVTIMAAYRALTDFAKEHGLS